MKTGANNLLQLTSFFIADIQVFANQDRRG